jgi:hypothetical protein
MNPSYTDLNTERFQPVASAEILRPACFGYQAIARPSRRPTLLHVRHFT